MPIKRSRCPSALLCSRTDVYWCHCCFWGSSGNSHRLGAGLRNGLQRCVGSPGDWESEGQEDLKISPQRDGVGEFETGSSWRCSMEGQEGAGAWGRDLPRAVSTWIVISTRLSFQWFCTRALLLPSVGLQPADDAGPCYPVSLNFCGCTFPIFFHPFYCGNLCILSVCCQVLLEVSLIHKDLFKAILSEAWRKFSHHLPSWMYNKHLYHLLNS